MSWRWAASSDQPSRPRSAPPRARGGSTFSSPGRAWNTATSGWPPESRRARAPKSTSTNLDAETRLTALNDLARAPIGVFDSGVGGLTVARAVMARLPAERLVYLGDTARVPYGTRSQATVLRYSRNAAR